MTDETPPTNAAADATPTPALTPDIQSAVSAMIASAIKDESAKIIPQIEAMIEDRLGGISKQLEAVDPAQVTAAINELKSFVTVQLGKVKHFL